MPANVYIPKSREKKKRRRFYLIPIYVFIIFYLIAASSKWFFLESVFFAIKKIEIVGNTAVSKAEMLDVLKSAVPDRGFSESVFGFNNFLAWPKEIPSSSLALMSVIKDLKIIKSYSEHNLVVKVEERKPFGVWCLDEAQSDEDHAQTSAENQRESALDQRESADMECWWFDEDGTIFKKAIFGEGSLISVVRDFSQERLGLNLKVLPDEFIPNIIYIIRVLRESELSIKEIVLEDISLREIKVSTYCGPEIYFSLNFQADSAREVIRDFRLKPEFRSLKYLDFRVENKLYYK